MEDISNEKIIEILKRIPFFGEFTDEDFPLMLGITQWVRFGAGDIIIREGTSERTFFFILKGRVAVKKKTGIGSLKKDINILSPGESFGEMSFITGSPRSADIIAEDTTYVLRFKAEEILGKQENPEHIRILFKLYKKFAEILADRLTKATSELAKPFM
jgi:CRP-like cAMP-binding protein